MKWGVLALALALSGCGADEAEVLQGAMDDKVTSANVEFAFVMGTGGEEMRSGVAGPYKSNGPGKLPSVDWQMDMGANQQSVLSDSRLVSSAEKAFIVYKGDSYEIAESDLGTFRPAALDLAQMRDWFPQIHGSEEASLDGEPVTRVTGRFDAKTAAADLKALGEKQDVLLGVATFPAAIMEELAKTATDPRFTVDVAREDGTLRRVEATMRAKKEGQTATIKLTIRLKDVGKALKIDAPTSGKPFAELGKRQVAESPAGQLYGDGGPDGELRIAIAVAKTELNKAVERWTAAMEELEANQDYDKGATESRRFADVIKGVRSAIADERGKSGALKRDRAELLAAMDGFQRALRTYADEIEVRDDQDALDAAAARLERTGTRYDEALAAFDPS